MDIKFSKARGHQQNRTIDPETLEWWNQQGPRVKEQVLKPSPNDVSPWNFIDELTTRTGYSLGELQQMLWYCRGPHFDAAIMEHLCNQFMLETPWHYAAVRDMRTWSDFYNIKIERPDNMIPHNAAEDACFEALQYLWVEHKGKGYG